MEMTVSCTNFKRRFDSPLNLSVSNIRNETKINTAGAEQKWEENTKSYGDA